MKRVFPDKQGKQLLFILVFLFFIPFLPGQQTAGGDSLFHTLPQPPAATANDTALLRLILASALLAVILGVVLYLVKRRNPQSANAGAITFHLKKYIGPKQYLTVVSIGDQHLLLGVTDHSISLLTKIEDISGLEETGLGGSALSFAHVLNRMKNG